MQQFILVVLAVFWAWSTLRYAAERYLGSAFAATRALHPLVVAAATTYLFYPDLVQALAAAGVVGLLVAAVDRVFNAPPATPAYLPRRRTAGGLPPLP